MSPTPEQHQERPSGLRLAAGLLVALVLPYVLAMALRPLFPVLAEPDVLLARSPDLALSLLSVLVATTGGALVARRAFVRPALLLWAITSALGIAWVVALSAEIARVSGQAAPTPWLGVIGMNAPRLIATLLATVAGAQLGGWLAARAAVHRAARAAAAG